jgi:hypothetical protein
VERVAVTGRPPHVDPGRVGLTQSVVEPDFEHGRVEEVVEF